MHWNWSIIIMSDLWSTLSPVTVVSGNNSILNKTFFKKKKVFRHYCSFRSPRPPYWQHNVARWRHRSDSASSREKAVFIPSVSKALFSWWVGCLGSLLCGRLRRWRKREPYNSWLSCHGDHGCWNKGWHGMRHHWDGFNISIHPH